MLDMSVLWWERSYGSYDSASPDLFIYVISAYPIYTNRTAVRILKTGTNRRIAAVLKLTGRLG